MLCRDRGGWSLAACQQQQDTESVSYCLGRQLFDAAFLFELIQSIFIHQSVRFNQGC